MKRKMRVFIFFVFTAMFLLIIPTVAVSQPCYTEIDSLPSGCILTPASGPPGTTFLLNGCGNRWHGIDINNDSGSYNSHINITETDSGYILAFPKDAPPGTYRTNLISGYGCSECEYGVCLVLYFTSFEITSAVQQDAYTIPAAVSIAALPNTGLFIAVPLAGLAFGGLGAFFRHKRR